MKNVLLYQHLGLGDHIICNGLIREICKLDHNFTIIAKPCYYQSVRFMFRDIKNLDVVSIKSGTPDEGENYSEILQYVQENQLEMVKIGHEKMIYQMGSDKSFYNQFNVGFDRRWSSFKVYRDYCREQKLFDKLNIDSDYIFIHDSNNTSRGAITKNINPNIRAIRVDPKLTDNIFDYLILIERAREIHCVESCFALLVDSFNFDGKLYFHRYARTYPPSLIPVLPTYQKNWTTLD
jgi:hypothetical protein